MALVEEYIWLKDGLSTQMDESGIITHSESCLVKFDEFVLTGPDAIADSNFEIGQVHRNNVNLFLNGSIQAGPIDENNAILWRFDLNYTTKGFNLSFTDEGIDVKTGSWTYNAIVEVDKETQEPILNPAGDPYDPMPEDIIACPLLMITMRENNHRIDRLEHVGSINQSSIRIVGINFPKYCAMLADYQSEPSVDEKGFTTFLNTFVIKGLFKKNKSGQIIGFKKESLARGFNQLENGEKVEIKVKSVKDPSANPIEFEEVPVAEPQMLDANGILTTTPYYQEWVTQDLHNFANFGLPSSYPVS